jgi:MFS family permease
VLRSTFSALRERDFALFFSGQVLSLTGTWLERLALSALVYRLSGYDERWLAFVGAAPAVPVFLVSVPAGALADRVPLLRLVLATQLLMMGAATGMALLVASGLCEAWHVAAYAVVASGLFAVDAPARQSLVPRLVGRGNLTNAIALGAVSFNAARFLGGFAFWVVVARMRGSAADCLAVNAASFAATIVGLLLIRARPMPEPGGGGGGPRLADGLRFARSTPIVRGALLCVLAASLFGFQVSHLLPVYAKKVWNAGDPGLGTLGAWMGAGALVGGLTLATRSVHVHKGHLIGLTGFGACLFLGFLGLEPPFWAGCALLAAAAFVLIQMHSASNAVIQAHVPDALRGRVMALFTLSVLGAFPVGGLLAGFLAKWWGAPNTTLAAALALAASLVAIRATHPELTRTA